jgi:hypothetical protein
MARLRLIVLGLLGISLTISPLAADDLVILNNDRLVADVVEGTIVHDVMAVSNTTPLPLKIINIRPTCGCTVMSNAEYTLDPFSVASIKYEFKSANYSGKIDRRILLSTINQTLTFQFSVNVRPFLKLSDTLIDIGEFQTDQVFQRRVEIIEEKGFPEIFLDDVYANTNFVKIVMVKERSGKNSLLITCKPIGIETFSQNVSVVLKSGEIRKTVSLNIIGQKKR